MHVLYQTRMSFDHSCLKDYDRLHVIKITAHFLNFYNRRTNFSVTIIIKYDYFLSPCSCALTYLVSKVR